jgi:hypothetical protein
MSDNEQYQQLSAAYARVVSALEWYGDLKYSHAMGLPPEVQWVAEGALKEAGLMLRGERPPVIEHYNVAADHDNIRLRRALWTIAAYNTLIPLAVLDAEQLRALVVELRSTARETVTQIGDARAEGQ